MMRGRTLALVTITLIFVASQGTVANPGGEGNGNRDYVCGGSCHGDPGLNAPSSATISVSSGNTAYTGTAYQFDTIIEIDTISHSRLLGVFLLSSTNGNGDNPEDHGWNIIQDPSGTTVNYVEVSVPYDGVVKLSWVLTAPEETGSEELIVAIHHGSGYEGLAYLGVSEPHTIEINQVPENLPGFALDWSAPNYRVTGDISPVNIQTQNATNISVEWKLEGESLSHPASVEANGEDDWLVYLPATMGDTRIVYRVTTSNGDYDVIQPWLTMGTIPPEFDGSLMGARAQGFAGAFMIIAIMVSLQGLLQPSRKKHELDQTEEVEAAKETPVESVVEEPIVDEDAAYRARLQKYDEHPGLLWDPVEEEWVNDPEYGGDE